MNQHLRALALHGLQENVEENFRPDRWLVFEHYDIIPDEAGNRYIYASPDRDDMPNEIRERLLPLSRTSADLFLRFARWPEETGMDKKLDTERNADAAKSWAETYGVLGLNPLDPFITDVVNSRRVTADYLGGPSPDDEARGRRSYARGGPPYETVANFAFEAWEAHIAWRLYESVRSEGRLDEATVIGYMSTINQREADISTGPLSDQPWVERDIYSSDSELIRKWALTVVTDALNRKIENHCYPILQGDAPGSYKPGWAFKSLLGAMWLQMMFLMDKDRRCWWCGKPLDPGMRSHAKYCDNDGQCRAAWNYHKGTGASGKERRRRGRYIG